MKSIFCTKVFLLLFLAGIWGAPLHAQTVKYTYDHAGNRVSREKVINMSMLKSGGGETGTAEIPVFEDVLSELKITIYPNPTKGMLKVDISGGDIPVDAKVFIYSFSGALIRQLNGISESNTVDISQQPPGVYIMRISFGNGHDSSWKIIKE